jgi:hypothetical protein
MKFSVKTSTAKWATEPALEVGRAAASPMAKMLSCSFDTKVCLSTGTWLSSSPSPSVR